MTITTEEMERLRVRLADLPGFDPVGLPARADADARRGVYVPGGPEGRWVWHGEDVYDADVWCSSSVSTADACTRDALARWVAGRIGFKPPHCTAPAFGWGGLNGPWWLTGHAGTQPFGPRAVPALATLSVADDRLLPDGSRWVDAAALAAVALHVGATHG